MKNYPQKQKEWLIAIFIVTFFAGIIPVLAWVVALLIVICLRNNILISKSRFTDYQHIENIQNEINNRTSKFEKEMKSKTVQFENQISIKKQEIESLKQEIQNLNEEKKNLSLDIITTTSEANTAFDLEDVSSTEIKNNISLLDLKEKELLKSDSFVIDSFDVQKKVINAQIKQILRSFNAETDSVLSNVSVKNIDTSRNKIMKSFDVLNKLYSIDGVQINEALLKLKLEKLNLIFEYQNKKELEKEQQRAIKEQMVEEEKVRREIAAAKKKIEKEEAQFSNEISKLLKYVQKTDSDIEKQLYIDKIKELESNIESLKLDKENVEQRETNTRAGFVYIISNIGSFGENIYKIGMTRRLEPMDRVKELSSASVPFEFDVHAMIFSEDAPSLENHLHNTFKNKSVNKVNYRKEFFNTSLHDIEKVVKEKFNDTVEFTLVAKAEQYRQSLNIK